ncbi:MAG TPA: OmpH family outer membrane protein [Terracidiphilus sp.]|jgi:outer membrane protein|nr:OmpH family outer membrane protein [Terracidiphilus sp.]
MKYLTVLAAALISCLSMAAAAQTPAATAPAGPEKIAVITFQQAVTQTNEFQRNFADLQTKFNPKRQQLKSLNDEIEALKKGLQTQGATLSDTERASRTRSLDEKEKQLQREAEDDQNDFKQGMQDTFNGVASKVGEVLISYAQRHGYSLVLDGGQEQAAVVLWANPSTDITREVIEAYNVKSGVPAPPAQPAASAPRPAPKAPASH